MAGLMETNIAHALWRHPDKVFHVKNATDHITGGMGGGEGIWHASQCPYIGTGNSWIMLVTGLLSVSSPITFT